MSESRPGDATGLRAMLERAAAGLVYSSESDRPFEFFTLSAPAPTLQAPLTVAGFATLVGAAPGTRVEERDLDAFLAHHLDRSDPHDSRAQQLRPRYEQLEATLRANLADVRVFRVGAIEIRCYIVGRAADGTLTGLVTTAVET